MDTGNSRYVGVRIFRGLRTSAALAAILTAANLRAASAETAIEENGWDVHVGLPLWAAGLKGTTGVRGREAKVDENFTDLLDFLDFAVSANGEARKNRWLFFGNGLYTKSSADADPVGLNEAELDLKTLLFNFGLGYNVLPPAPFSLEPFVGGRVQYVEEKLSLEFPAQKVSFSGSKAWADPIVGLLAQYRISAPFAFFTEADIGGFGVSSDLTWQVNAGIEWNVTDSFYLRASYRHLDTDFEDGGFKFDIEQSGPQLEFGMRF